MAVMMKCGHAAQGVNSKGEPVCVICIGIDPGATVVADEPDLTGRKAICDSCKSDESIVDSSTDLAFFEYRKDSKHKIKGHEEKDSYYCGCRGWD